jgi:hypothetical protein
VHSLLIKLGDREEEEQHIDLVEGGKSGSPQTIYRVGAHVLEASNPLSSFTSLTSDLGVLVSALHWYSLYKPVHRGLCEFCP